MAYHAFERICSLWFERVKNHFVIENYPIRYSREKTSKYSPSTSTTDIDLISYSLEKPYELNLCECKSNINQTFHNKSRTKLIRQLEAIKKHSERLPFVKTTTKINRYVFGIKIAERIKSKFPKNVQVIEGEDFEKDVLNELIRLIGRDPKIDPKDDVLSILRLLWHFGILNDKYYYERAKEIYFSQKNITPKQLKEKLGLITYKTSYCKELLNELKNDK